VGGVKKKSMASMEKQQESQDEDQQAGQSQKGKTVKEQKAAPPQQKRLPFLAPNMSEGDMVKTLTPLKAITIYTASRALGVNASIATGVLRDLEAKKLVKRVGGFSGHFVWAPAQTS
jgi:small subunit ribosomal protein S25e